jgi:hypothetical protein
MTVYCVASAGLTYIAILALAMMNNARTLRIIAPPRRRFGVPTGVP